MSQCRAYELGMQLRGQFGVQINDHMRVFHWTDDNDMDLIVGYLTSSNLDT